MIVTRAIRFGGMYFSVSAYSKDVVVQKIERGKTVWRESFPLPIGIRPTDLSSEKIFLGFDDDVYPKSLVISIKYDFYQKDGWTEKSQNIYVDIHKGVQREAPSGFFLKHNGKNVKIKNAGEMVRGLFFEAKFSNRNGRVIF